MKLLTVIFALAASAMASPFTSPEAPAIEARSIMKRAFGPAPSTGEICPQAQGLYFRANSTANFQVACDVNVSGGTLLAVYPNISNALACFAQCDLWNVQVPGNKCTASSWYRFSPDGVNNCFSRKGSWTAYEASFKTLDAFNAVSGFPL